MTAAAARSGALTEAAILDAALAIICTDGIDGLTMRRLSTRLGVALGATYHHVRNKHALLVLVADSLFASVEVPSPEHGDWSAQVRRSLLSVTRVFAGKPELVSYVLGHFDEMAPTDLMVGMRGALAEAGFTPGAVDDALFTLFFYVAGTLVGDFTMLGNARRARDLRQRFEHGLDIILRGIGADLDTGTAKTRTPKTAARRSRTQPVITG